MGEIITESVKYIKNVNHQGEDEWAYSYDPEEDHPHRRRYHVGAYFRLNFNNSGDGDSVKKHVENLSKGDRIILSQTPTKGDKRRYLTHVVELVNEGIEDKDQWESDTWGIFRWVKIHWIADFKEPNNIPLDKDVMKVNWGWYDTKAKKLDSRNLMNVNEWKGDINRLRTHLEKVFR